LGILEDGHVVPNMLIFEFKKRATANEIVFGFVLRALAERLLP